MAVGFLIALEGIDGAGKTTVADAVVAALEADGRRVMRTQEPTATWLGETLRRALKDPDVPPWSDALLFMADHVAHVARVRDRVAAGDVVVTDRWSDSTFAYQGAALAAPGFDAVAHLQAMEAPFDLRPDLVVWLDVAVDVAVERLASRGQSAEKFEKRNVLAAVRANYERLAKAQPDRYVRVDANRPASDVAAAAVAAVRARVPKR